MSASTFRRTVAALTVVVAASTALQVRGAEPLANASRVAGLERAVGALEQRLRSPRMAQMFERPAEDVPGAPRSDGPQAQGEDPSLRIDRLEAKLRDLTGRVELAEHEVRRLDDEIKKFKQDVDFRLQDLAAARGKSRHSDAEEQPAEPSTAPAPARAKHRNDAFDPDADPGAPGSPRPLGKLSSADAVPNDRKPAGGSLNGDDGATGPLDLNGPTNSIPRRRAGSLPGDDLPPRSSATDTGSPAGGARAEFDEAVSLLRQKQYQTAETNFQTFIQKHPHDRLVADAVYYLGETYALRGRQREAAEQFLKVSTDYAKSARAPDGMVKLGVSLNALGAKEQACATFDDLARKFPKASTAVKNSADRESKRARC